MTEPTYAEGELTADDLIVSADGTGYETPSEFVAGENGIEPDDPPYETADDSYDSPEDSYDDPADDPIDDSY